MKVVLAPNAFKGSLTAMQAARTMATGAQAAGDNVQVAEVPVADGGDSLVEVLVAVMGGSTLSFAVSGPLGDTVTAKCGYISDKSIGIIEMALASGLALLDDDETNPMQTTTIGTGELIARLLDEGARHIIAGIGGSATNDGGIGMASALGVKFLDENDKPVQPVGGELNRIHKIDMSDLDPRISDCTIEVACDVDNPLLGRKGAAHVYAPQKGATPEQVEELDKGLSNLADCIERDLGVDVRCLAGAGAAGGLGAGLKAFLGAELRPGVDVVLDLVNIDAALEGANLVITAEGSLDNQTASGKAPAGVARRAKEMGVPCIALAGKVDEDISALHEIGIVAAFSICNQPLELQTAMSNAEILLRNATEQVVRCFGPGR